MLMFYSRLGEGTKSSGVIRGDSRSEERVYYNTSTDLPSAKDNTQTNCILVLEEGIGFVQATRGYLVRATKTMG